MSKAIAVVPPSNANAVPVGRPSARQSNPTRIASPEMFPEAEMLPHLICSRPIFIGGANDEADQYGGARRVGGCGGRPVCEGRSGRTGSDSRRVCGGNRLSLQACDAAVAGWAGESAK